jgi:hypothetical protein
MWDPTYDDRSSGAPDDDDVVMTMLEHHVPLALLVDLTDPGDPESAEIFAEEGAPDVRWWEH